MPTYFYTAVSQAGESKTGYQEAKDEKELASLLRQQGFVLTSAKTKESKGFSFRFDLSADVFGIPLEEKLMFVRNLRVMVGAGVALPKSLDILSQQVRSKTFKKAVLDMKEKIVQGKALSQTLDEHPEIFSELFANMVRVGEESGTLENVLSQLALQLEKEHELRTQITGALLYPAIIVVAMIGIGILMLVTVVPKLAQTFKELGVELPFTTRLVINTGTFLSQKWYFAFPALLALLFLAFRSLGTKKGKRIMDAFMLKAPLLSDLVRKTNSATTLRTLSSLIATGVPIVRGLEITSRVVGNVFFGEALEQAAKEVAKGAKVSDSLAKHEKLYPILVTQMVSVGEETGESSEILAKLAEFYEEEVTQVTKNLASVIEPLLMLVIGGVVGFFAVSMISPMYSLLNSIK
ncbi:MAG: hypothetical protein A2842_02400 [Candidatus Wildermuthbacteria bacterium RIFCSPHIGHO2_01_FULL_48_25]|uniref:Type II secretion system protein GspF domain-containing protein n=1 Tax=Candidatus Wildermuthbacteria bacterium RIFCSPLOWO2_01_FULL_48_16 TaxID=1802461 RepID=A0A1G2RK32_9BACT|nr:MAG: hypothetical protein A2842_02400 [Candidatus Wildermuthbacteria bacterium RIFCSPHIGHO2_01_FULL_48_25]OHA73215.1 MAG: hypothetical protein A3B24_01125 [Candidatus Wildermuthbacteria bacterium RIFCSPLOWO2_01_FULL_48_16]